MEPDIEAQKFNTYCRLVFYSSLVILAAYVIVLYRVYKGSQYLFLYIISLMLLISNVCAILSNLAMKVWFKDPAQIDPYLYLETTSAFIRDALFNLAHWIFCFRYWVIAVEMEALLNYKVISEQTRARYKTFDFVVIVLDVLMPLWYSIMYCTVNYKQVNKITPSYSLQIQYILALYSRGLLLVLSASLLTDSIFRIKKSILKVDNTHQLNKRSFMAYLLVLFIFIFSTFCYYVAITFGQFHQKNIKAQITVYDCLDVSTILNFVQQVFLVVLFWFLGAKQQEQTKVDRSRIETESQTSEFTGTIVDESDSQRNPSSLDSLLAFAAHKDSQSKAQLNKRIFQQFIKREASDVSRSSFLTQDQVDEGLLQNKSVVD